MKIKMRALKAFPYGGARLAKGQDFEARKPLDATMLRAARLAVDAPPPAAREAAAVEKRRRTRGRDSDAPPAVTTADVTLMRQALLPEPEPAEPADRAEVEPTPEPAEDDADQRQALTYSRRDMQAGEP